MCSKLLPYQNRPTEYKTAVKAFAYYFEPQKCVDHHVYIFRQESQKSGENITEFLRSSSTAGTQM